MRALAIGMESGAGRGGRSNLPTIKIGKVVSVRREDHSVDLAFLDGNILTKVPVLSGWLGSQFGAVCLTAPSYDPKQKAKKTYPESDSAVHAATNTSEVGRDIYAVVLQAEGSFLGTAGQWVIGFLPPQVSEMLFARHALKEDGTPIGEEGEFDDLFLFRHPSDVQSTIARDGKFTLQFPGGSRVALGEDVEKVILTKKDYDRRYQLRHNLNRLASILLRAIGQGGVESATVLASAGGALDLFGLVTVSIRNLFSRIMLLASGDIEIDTHGGRGPETEPVESGDDNAGLPGENPNGGDIRILAKRNIIEIADQNVLIQGQRIDLN